MADSFHYPPSRSAIGIVCSSANGSYWRSSSLGFDGGFHFRLRPVLSCFGFFLLLLLRSSHDTAMGTTGNMPIRVSTNKDTNDRIVFTNLGFVPVQLDSQRC